MGGEQEFRCTGCWPDLVECPPTTKMLSCLQAFPWQAADQAVPGKRLSQSGRAAIEVVPVNRRANGDRDRRAIGDHGIVRVYAVAGRRGA